jgi:hypothetical protein
MTLRHRQPIKQYLSAETTGRDMRYHGNTILRQMQDTRVEVVIREITSLFYYLHPNQKMQKLSIDNDSFSPTYKVISAVNPDTRTHHEVWCAVGFDGITSFSERVIKHVQC